MREEATDDCWPVQCAYGDRTQHEVSHQRAASAHHFRAAEPLIRSWTSSARSVCFRSLVRPGTRSLGSLRARSDRPPSSTHYFGTDELGRDILSRILFGARISLAVGFAVVAISLLLGVLAGSVAGYYGGLADTLLNVYFANAFLALPGILLAIAFVAFLGPGLLNVILALSLSGWVNYARLMRAQIMSVKEREFVEAARSLGASDLRMLLRHGLPNSVQPLVVQATVGMAGAVLSEATLSFLGLGVPPPTPSWGAMLNDARSHLFDSPHLVFFPALAIMLLVLAFNFVGDALRDLLDPRLQRRSQ